MNKLILLKGTEGKEKAEEKTRLLGAMDGGVLYCNRRTMRTYASNKNLSELEIVRKQRKAVQQCLGNRANVIVDVLGLTFRSEKKWQKIAKSYGATLEIREWDAGWGEYVSTQLFT